MTDDELKEIVASLAIAQKETDRQLQENRQAAQGVGKADRWTRGEVRRLYRRAGPAFDDQNPHRTLRHGGRHLPVLTKVRKQGKTLELDVLAYANSEQNEAFVDEVKSHLRPEGIDQLRQILTRFRQLQARGRRLYASSPSSVRLRSVQGSRSPTAIYPENFQPRIC